MNVAPLTALVVWTKSDVLASVICDALRGTAGIEVVASQFVSSEEIASLLDKYPKLDALVVVGDDVPATELLRRHPRLVISRVSVGYDAVHFNVRRLGLSQVKALIQALASSRSTATSQGPHLYHVEAPSTGVPCLRAKSGSSESTLLRLGTEWITAALLKFNTSRTDRGSELPGLPLSRQGLAQMLSPSAVDMPSVSEADSTLLEAQIALMEALAQTESRRQPLGALFHACSLSEIELHLLLLALAPELDLRFQQAFGSLHEDMARRAPSLPLACAILGVPLEVRSLLHANGHLTLWRLLEGDPSLLPSADRLLQVDPFIAAWLLGEGAPLTADPRLAGAMREQPWPGARWLCKPADISKQGQLAELMSGCSEGPEQVQLIALCGDTDGWQALVESAAAKTALPLVRISSAHQASASTGADDVATLLARLALLTSAVPVVIDDEDLDTAVVTKRRGLTALLGAMLVAGKPCIVISCSLQNLVGHLPQCRVALLERDMPDATVRGGALTSMARELGLTLEQPVAEGLAAQVPLSLEQLATAARMLASRGYSELPEEDRFSELTKALRQVASPGLPRFAQRLEPSISLNDVVLPPDRRAQLDELVSHVDRSVTVLNTWGFGRQLNSGRGVAALFCGPSGTGKTMAAQGIARALRTDVYVIDLARIVSKFIGETEKNLDAIFADAERASAVLLFDEADALFGKRSEVKDAHDRYANIEVAYLLQRMETFTGVAILTTNLRQNIDQAFLRRLRFVVEFPHPDAGARLAIWRKCFPRTAPMGKDVDFSYLARRLDITGGHIRQIAVRAAFAAASAGAPAIGMTHLVAAARSELTKLGMSAAEREMADYAARFDKPDVRAA